MTLPNDPRELNPYASPTTAPWADSIEAPYALRKELKSLQLLVVWLGALWIAVGLVIVTVGGALLLVPTTQSLTVLVIAGVIGLVGAIWVLIGFATCAKQMTAIYAGLVFSYLHLGLCAFSFNICTGLVLLALVLHAHRVLHWAAALQRKGIPLTTRPQDIETRLQIPPQPE